MNCAAGKFIRDLSPDGKMKPRERDKKIRDRSRRTDCDATDAFLPCKCVHYTHATPATGGRRDKVDGGGGRRRGGGRVQSAA